MRVWFELTSERNLVMTVFNIAIIPRGRLWVYRVEI